MLYKLSSVAKVRALLIFLISQCIDKRQERQQGAALWWAQSWGSGRFQRKLLRMCSLLIKFLSSPCWLSWALRPLKLKWSYNVLSPWTGVSSRHFKFFSVKPREPPTIMRKLQVFAVSKRRCWTLMSQAIDLRESSKLDQSLKEGFTQISMDFFWCIVMDLLRRLKVGV